MAESLDDLKITGELHDLYDQACKQKGNSHVIWPDINSSGVKERLTRAVFTFAEIKLNLSSCLEKSIV